MTTAFDRYGVASVVARSTLEFLEVDAVGTSGGLIRSAPGILWVYTDDELMSLDPGQVAEPRHHEWVFDIVGQIIMLCPVSPSRLYVAQSQGPPLNLDVESMSQLAAPNVASLFPDRVFELAACVVDRNLAYLAINVPGGPDGNPSSLLALVDVRTDSLVDVDSAAEGLQGIPLQAGQIGYISSMALDPDDARMFLIVDQGAGIELVDLESSRSMGTVIDGGSMGGRARSLEWIGPDKIAAIVERSHDDALVLIVPSTTSVAGTVFAADRVVAVAPAGGDWVLVSVNDGLQLVNLITGVMRPHEPLRTDALPGDIELLFAGDPE